MADLEGNRLGEYRILRRLSHGGMGDIYLAEQGELRRQVAVKVVRETATPDAAARAHANLRFAREARAVAALEHPHILPIYGYGEQDGVHFLAMQYVPDGSLADVLAPGPLHRLDLPVPPNLVAVLIEQASEALQYAHDHGVIHRDVKPHNLLVRVLGGSSASVSASTLLASGRSGGLALRPHVLLADFGLARFIEEVAGRTGTTGTPLYSAPEQYEGRPVPATDQYALACVAHLLLTGQPVFDGTVVELHHQHLTLPPPPASGVNSHLPVQVDAVLARALAKQPDARYPSMRAFAEALRSAITLPSVNSHEDHSGQERPVPWPVSPAPLNTRNVSPDAHAQMHPGLSRLPGTPWPSATAPLPSAPPMAAASLPPGPAPSFTTTSAPASRPLAPHIPPGPNSGSGASSLPTPSSPYLARSTYAPAAASSRNLAQAAATRREPDAPGAPIPRVRKKREKWGPLPVSKPVALALLVALVVMSTAGTVGWNVSHPPIAPQVPTLATINVAHAGQTNVAHVTRLHVGQHPIQATLPVRLLSAMGASRVDTAKSLPLVPASSPSFDHVAAAKTVQAKYGIGQLDLGTVTPIDVSIASNDHYVLEAVDGALQIYGYNGQVDGPMIALTSLFAPVLQPKDTLGQPRVIFDAAVGQWVLVANEVEVQGGAVTNGFFDVAISQDAQPLSTWVVYQFSTQEGYPAGCTWADDPHIGSDAAGYYISGNSFECGDAGAFRGALLFDLPKHTFGKGVGRALLRWAGVFQNANHKPALGVVPAAQTGSDGTEWLASDDAGYVAGGQTSRGIIVWALLNTHAVEHGGTPALIGVVTPLPTPYADPPGTAQPDSATPLATGDARITNVFVVGEHLYLAFTTAVNWKGDTTTRSGIYWADILTKVQAPASSGVGTTIATSVAQSGIVGIAGSSTFYPALAADSAGDLVLAANVASSTLSPSVIFTSRMATDAKGALGAGGKVVVLAQGTQSYPGAHWGDYSGATVASLSPDGGTVTVWVAAPYMDSVPAHWQTLAWQLTLR